MGAAQMTRGEFIDGVPVQVLKPGKRSKSIGFRAPVESQIPLTTVIMETDRTAEHVPPSAEGDRRTAQERLEDEQRAKARAVAERLQAGTVWINTYKLFSISTPFSGWKESGMGREKGRLGIREYMQQKSLYWGLNDAPLAWAN